LLMCCCFCYCCCIGIVGVVESRVLFCFFGAILIRSLIYAYVGINLSRIFDKPFVLLVVF